METPIYDFVQQYKKEGIARFHMPGHKGHVFLGCEPEDITEINGADDLFHPHGIIRKSEANATALFGARQTFYATGGSTQCIGAMLFLALLHGCGRKILAGRNAHKAFLHACALLDLEVIWLTPKESTSLCACPVTEQELENALTAMEELPLGVFLTSPDYLGGMVDVAVLSGVCKKFDVPLLVDHAHGAYMKFLQPSAHPLDLGASMCCDSAHKTLPVLTGGAYLHIGKDAPKPFEEDGKKALSLFGSTSPSYLTLQSLDLCNAYLAEGYGEKLSACISEIEALKERLKRQGVVFFGGEPLKIVFDCAAMGISGETLAERLRNHKVEGEFVDTDALVLMVSPENTKEDFFAMEAAFSDFAPKAPRLPLGTAPKLGTQVCSVREGIFAKQEMIPVGEALGRICASPVVACPPAIPIAVSGERITEEMVTLFSQYGISHISVVCP